MDELEFWRLFVMVLGRKLVKKFKSFAITCASEGRENNKIDIEDGKARAIMLEL